MSSSQVIQSTVLFRKPGSYLVPILNVNEKSYYCSGPPKLSQDYYCNRKRQLHLTTVIQFPVFIIITT